MPGPTNDMDLPTATASVCQNGSVYLFQMAGGKIHDDNYPLRYRLANNSFTACRVDSNDKINVRVLSNTSRCWTSSPIDRRPALLWMPGPAPRFSHSVRGKVDKCLSHIRLLDQSFSKPPLYERDSGLCGPSPPATPPTPAHGSRRPRYAPDAGSCVEPFAQNAYRVNDAFLGLPIPIYFVIMTYAIIHIIMTGFRFGRHVYTIGGNERVSLLQGIKVDRKKIKIDALIGAVIVVAVWLGNIKTAHR